MDIPMNAEVYCRNKLCGTSTYVVLKPTTEQVTHLVLRESHFWGHKDVTIPVSQIDRLEEETVYLKLDKHSIEALPSTPA